MPEYPDIVVYLEALEKRIMGRTLERVSIASPFLLRTAVPPISSVEGRKVSGLRRLGKRICFGLDEDLWLVLHLMIAGRLHWKDGAVVRPSATARRSAKAHLAEFQFDNGVLSLTEAGTQRRASLHVVEGEAGLRKLDPGGLELFQKPGRKGGPDHVDLETFAAALTSENHTLKRALTDPRLFSGIGNAYSDEIFFAAQLSPIKLTQKLTDQEIERLYLATRAAPGWPCTAAIVNPARAAARRFSAFAMLRTKPTIVRRAKRAASCSPTARSRASCAKTGPGRLKNSGEFD